MHLLPPHLVQLILGRRLSKSYELRPMRATDLKHFYEDIERAYYGVQHRTCHIEMVVHAKDGNRRPVFALVAVKGASRKATVQVKALGKSEALAPDEYLRFLALGLLATQYYGLQDGATRVRVSHIPKALVGFYVALGYVIESKGRSLYAVRDITAPYTH